MEPSIASSMALRIVKGTTLFATMLSRPETVTSTMAFHRIFHRGASRRNHPNSVSVSIRARGGAKSASTAIGS